MSILAGYKQFYNVYIGGENVSIFGTTRETYEDASNEKPETKLDASVPELEKTNKNFSDLLGKLGLSGLTASGARNRELDKMSDDISTITHRNLADMTGQTGPDITRFLNKVLQSKPSGPFNTDTSLEGLFNRDDTAFGAFFYERYKNINNKYEDLRIITDYLYELQGAVDSVRDDILTADDIANTVSRELSFEDAVDKEDAITNYTKIVEDMERKYDLKNSIKNYIIPKTLTYGNFFVYTIPYSEVFAQADAMGKTQDNAMFESVSAVNEDFIPTLKYGKKYKPVVENMEWVKTLTEDYNTIATDPDFSEVGMKKKTHQDIYDGMKQILENVTVINDPKVFLLEDTDMNLLASSEEVRDMAKKAYKDISSRSKPFHKKDMTAQSTDGVIDPLQTTTDADRRKYKDITGVYMRRYDPTRIIPVYLMDSCVGYYLLYETYGEVRNSILLNSSLNRANLAFQQVKKKQLEDDVVQVIASKICSSIDKKFVADNPKFKDLMVNALSYQDFYKKQFKVQFIPEDYMTYFKIDEDDETHLGTSLLAKSLFYGKLYLCLLLFKIITILTKSNDMRVYYIKNAGINKNMTQVVQNAARAIKDRQISFNDLASIQTVFSKVGMYKEAFIPTGRSGERSIEFETIAGQDVQLNTELMELLRKGMINNTGVPSVILSFMEEVDFAKTITMQHAKYMAKIITLQSQLEIPTTALYKKILGFEGLLPPEALTGLNVTFTRPKTLGIQTTADLISAAQSNAEFIADTIAEDPNDEQEKADLKRTILRNVLLRGVFDWTQFSEIAKEAVLHRKKAGKEKELTNPAPAGAGATY